MGCEQLKGYSVSIQDIFFFLFFFFLNIFFSSSFIFNWLLKINSWSGVFLVFFEGRS